MERQKHVLGLDMDRSVEKESSAATRLQGDAHISTATVNHPVTMTTPIIHHSLLSALSRPARRSQAGVHPSFTFPPRLCYQRRTWSCQPLRKSGASGPSVLSACALNFRKSAEASLWLSLSLSLPSPPLRAHGNIDCGHKLPGAG